MNDFNFKDNVADVLAESRNRNRIDNSAVQKS